MTLPATYALTDPAFTASLVRALGTLNTLYARDEVLVSSDGLTFSARRGNWQTPPPVEVRLNGQLVSPPAITLDLTTGSVTFATAPPTDAIVAASYAAALFAAADLQAILTDAFYQVEVALGYGLDDTAIPRGLKPAIDLVAHARALERVLSERLDGYLWRVDGREVDRRQMAAMVSRALDQLRDWAAEAIAVARLTLTTPQTTAPPLNIDLGQKPAWWSQYPIHP